MIFDPVTELSKRLASLDNIDAVIGELEDKQKWLVKYVELKRAEKDSADQQITLKSSQIVKLLDQILVKIDDSLPEMKDQRDQIKESTDHLNNLCERKDTLTKQISEMERVQVLVANVQLLEECLFDPKKCSFKSAADAVNLIKSLEQVLTGEAALVWIEKARKLVPAVVKAAFDQYKQTKRLELCSVINTCPDTRISVINWLSIDYLRDYEAVYSNSNNDTESQKLSSLTSRMSWLMRVLERVDSDDGFLFPVDWMVSHAVIARWSLITGKAMQMAVKREQKHDLFLANLRAAIKTANSFERHLRMTRALPEDFYILADSFHPYLSILIDAWEVKLREHTLELAQSVKGKTFTLTTWLSQNDDRFIFKSADELLQIFKEGLMDVSSLTQGPMLGGLVHIYQAAIDDYCGCMQLLMDKRINSKKRIRESERIETCCVLINTIDHVCESVRGMQETFKRSLTRVSHLQRIEFDVNKLMQLVNDAVGCLSRLLVAAMDPVWLEFRQQDLMRVKETRDQSGYVKALIDYLHSGQAFSSVNRMIIFENRHRWIMISFAKLFLEKFESELRALRPISSVGAEQLWIDVQTFKPVLQSMDPSCEYRDFVNVITVNLERTLKILLHDALDATAFVAHYYLMSDGDGREDQFRRVVELKIAKPSNDILMGVSGMERYLEAFRRHQPDLVSKRHVSNNSEKGTFAGTLKKRFTSLLF